MHKILAIIPKIANKFTDYTFPVGAAYVVASLKTAGFQVDCLNLSHHDTALENILKQNYQLDEYLLCITAGLSSQYPQVEHVVSVVQRLASRLPIAVGGGLVSSLPELAVQELKADFGVIGEGEVTEVELARALKDKTDPLEVAGLVVRDRATGRISRTAARQPIENLDDLPFPDFEALGFAEMLEWQLPTSSLFTYYYDRPRIAPIIASRSCPYNCTFCFHPLGKKYRQRSLGSIFSEIDFMVKKYQANIIMVYDELFAEKKDRSRVVDFCTKMRQRNLKWIVQLRVDLVDEEMLKLFKESGCIIISYGIESGCQTILDSMKKHITVEQTEKALEATQKAGIGMVGTILFGDPAETQDTFFESFNWWMRMRHYRIPLTPIYVYPGSEMYEIAKRKGLISDEAAYMKIPYPIINNTSMSDNAFNAMMGMMEMGRRELAFYPGLLVGAAFQEIDKFGRPLITVRVRCPHCLSVSEYRNMHHVPQRTKYVSCGCRDCNQRFDIPSIEDLGKRLMSPAAA